MSGLLQPGQHPDADQLSAFAEHALPAHEHDGVLAHLAVCPDCRAVVFIALPPMEVVAEPATAPTLTPQPASSRRRWFSGWNLAWPVAAAFAILLITFAIRHQITPRSSGTGQIAEAPPQGTPGAASPALVPRAATVPERPAAQRASATPEAPHTAVPVNPASQAAQAPTLTYMDVQDLPLNGRDTTEMLKVPPGAVSVQAQGSATGVTGAASVAGRGTAGIPEPAPSPAAAPTVANASRVSVDAEANASATVISGDALNALSSDAKAPRTQPLPSHLEAVSVATYGTRTLAIDTAHTVFFSVDSGQHWETVHPIWQGRAVRVALASQPAAVPMAAARAAFTGRVAVQAPVTAAAPAPPSAPITASTPGASSLSGNVTDFSGVGISGATVTIANTANSASTTLRTDRSGHYAASLPAGSYSIEVSAPGFAPRQLGVTLAAGQPSLSNVKLSVGAVTDTVTVTSAAGQVLTEQAQPLTATVGAPGSTSSAPIFAITTESGARWTSPDGEHWTRE